MIMSNVHHLRFPWQRWHWCPMLMVQPQQVLPTIRRSVLASASACTQIEKLCIHRCQPQTFRYEI